MKSNSGSQYFQQDRVYDSDHLALALPANLPGGSYRYLVEEKDNKEEQKTIVEDFYSNREIRVYKDFAPTIRSERLGLKVVEDN